MPTKPTKNLTWGTTAGAIAEPISYVKTDGLAVDDVVPAAWYNWIKRAVSRWVSWLDTTFSASGLSSFDYAQFFGNGRDGNATITTTIVLTRDMYYNNLTLGASGVLNVLNFRVFVAGTLTFSSSSGAGAIRADGAAAPAATTVAVPSSSTVKSLADGGAGGNGSVGGAISSIGAAASAASDSRGTLGGKGGKGGNGGGTTSSSVGRTGPSGTYNGYSIQAPSLSYFIGSALKTYIGGLGGSGGCGGNGGTGNSGPNGACGAQGGGVLCIFARTVVLGSSTPAAIIRANGGAGATGLSGNTTAAGAGGGGGGGGGYVLLAYETLTSPGITGAISCPGGTGGQPGAAGGGADSPTNGQGGDGGDGGAIDTYNFTTNTWTRATGTAGAAGAFTLTNAAGGTCTLTL